MDFAMLGDWMIWGLGKLPCQREGCYPFGESGFIR